MLEENDYYAALGMDESGEKEQEAAEPVEQSESQAQQTGEQAQKATEPAQTSQPEAMSLQERRQNAAARRKREMEAAVEQAREEEREKFRQREKDFFARAGLKKPWRALTTLNSGMRARSTRSWSRRCGRAS